MKLPIEIEDTKEDEKTDIGDDTEEDDSPTQTTDTSKQEKFCNWNRFVHWIQCVFGYQRSSTIDQPYRTAVYSLSKIDQFVKCFDKRNRSETDLNRSSSENLWDIAEKNYFTTSERHWLTYELLSRIKGKIITNSCVSSEQNLSNTSDICGSFGHNTDMCPLCDKTCSFWKLSDSCVYAQISYVFDNVATVIFAILMSIWARGFVEGWKRGQSELQCRWDSIDFHECNEPIRPDFEKQVRSKRKNIKTGRKESHVSIEQKLPKILLSISVVLLMIIIVCLTIFSIIVYRIQITYVLKNVSVSSYSSIIITVTSAIMNLICSLILSPLYYYIAQKITDYELHKYQSEYEAAFSLKVYIFEFINFYSSLFYVAFFKGRSSSYPSTYGAQRTNDFTEQCDPAGCMVELSIQLLIIMVGKQIVNTVIEYGLPFLSSRKLCKNTDENKKQWEIDNQLDVFDWQMLLPEYLEMTIQFGFITLFVAAFPLAPLFALLNNILEIRFDAWKLLTRYRRPVLHKAANIGIWTAILSSISYFAVLTNGAVIAWTSEFIPKLAYQSIEGKGTSLDGYVNWTLSLFPISDYNRTGTMNPNIPSNLTYCRYRDFRESIGPNYNYTSLYWHIIAARLAFMIIFENVIYLIVYLVELMVPDVSSHVQEAIDRQRYSEQSHRDSPPKTPSAVKEQHVIKNHKEHLFLCIEAVSEGTSAPITNFLITIEDRDPKCASLTRILETIFLGAWYPIIVATNSREIKQN
ncbi:unnamed protein product [Rotaria sordida]|uniref:Anoctamin n=1 Tax=Rotaria sordida TaxID=392033 RepID=A0A814ATS2_9BILA|nr:unnamed protein product [Rotaria sordida]CAF0952425.1 unnamed protein product [Rotaria sordida]CAF0955929.1 unnamed protein product [Rotaria sordida]